jgi:hypothetical protein
MWPFKKVYSNEPTESKYAYYRIVTEADGRYLIQYKPKSGDFWHSYGSRVVLKHAVCLMRYLIARDNFTPKVIIGDPND